MGRVAKVVAFLFRLLNFFLDLVQTWQFAGSGGMGGVITFIISWLQGMPIWAVILLSLAASIIIVIILSLVFTTFRRKTIEDRELRKLPRLVLGIHKRISTKRIKLVKNIDWDNIDKSKVIEPMFDFIFGNIEKKDIKIDDDSITKGIERLNTIGSRTGGAPSVLDTVLKKSDTSLDKELKKDFRYQYLLAKLDGYKPYPNNAIRNSVQTVIKSFFSLALFNPSGVLMSQPSSSLHTIDPLRYLNKRTKSLMRLLVFL